MSTIEVYEPSLCCSTGVCGPDVDQNLVTFTADLDWARAQGADIARHNLASEPTAFVERPEVVKFLQLSGSEGLPLVVVDGAVAVTGRYPARQELARWAGVGEAPAPGGRTELGLTGTDATEGATAGSCGCGAGGC